jgi:hypothetical protein
MPYSIENTSEGDYVVNSDTKRRMNKKPLSADRAKRYLRALYANVPDSTKAKDHSGVVVILQVPLNVASVLEFFAGTGLAEIPESGISLVPATEMHITLLYLGDISEWTPEAILELKTTIGAFAIQYYDIVGESICGSVQGTGRFNDVGDGLSALYFAYSSPCLAGCQDDLAEAVGIDSENGFIPHITYAYVPQEVGTPTIMFPDIPLEFCELVLAAGPDQYIFKLAGDDSMDASASYDTSAASAVTDAMVTAMNEMAVEKEVMEESDETESDMIADVTVYKTTSGKYRWVMYSSNGFEDRDGECVATAALEEDCARADLLAQTVGTKAYGPLRYCHLGGYAWDTPGDWTSVYATEGMDLGDCDFNMVLDGILVESGTFYKEEYGDVLQKTAGRIRGSIRFDRPLTEPDSEKVYHHIRRFERSIVPLGWALPSNRFTSFNVKESTNGSYQG